MPKLGVFSGSDVCRILERNGFINVRQRGSHVVMQKPGLPTRTVPVPLHRELRTGTLLSIIRQSGISRDSFEK
ncbi:MAG TPA: type II toxin-antitoxin system HicA family toxin [Kiritimatiellia bacterium]|nr:type II toxin-antitoxin system HicA family toxin [Kiritimatiellia bacterium]